MSLGAAPSVQQPAAWPLCAAPAAQFDLHSLAHPPSAGHCPECLSDIPVRARRCKHCCSAVEPIEPKKKLSASRECL